jgi:hypothetical protein
LTPQGRQKILDEYRQHGYGYADYAWMAANGGSSGGYGISISAKSRVIELARNAGPWEQVYYHESGWHTIQDVHAFMLRAPHPPPGDRN